MESEAQERYLAHQQAGKKRELVAIMKERHSNRRFSDLPVGPDTIEALVDSTKHCPSSCDRHGVRLKIVTERDEKELLGGLLVGGVGWCHRAPVMLLMFANPVVYKADGGNEVKYNAFLDAGAMLQQMSLLATDLDLHCAFVNPNIRQENRTFFQSRFAPWPDAVFCGAFCFGWPHPEAIPKERNLIGDMTV